MPDFNVKMQQNRFRLGELAALPRPLAGFKGPTSKGRGGDDRGGDERGRSTSLPPRFENPGYGPVWDFGF